MPHSTKEIFEWVLQEYKGPRPGNPYDPSALELVAEELLKHRYGHLVTVHRTDGRKWLETDGIFYDDRGNVIPEEIGDRWERTGPYGCDKSTGDSMRWAGMGDPVPPLFAIPYRYFEASDPVPTPL